jgi:hypothetical protein
MQGAGIFDGDLVIVDRALEARHGISSSRRSTASRCASACTGSVARWRCARRTRATRRATSSKATSWRSGAW